MAPRRKVRPAKQIVQDVDVDSDKDFTGQDVNKCYLKTPTYTRNFPFIVSRHVGYKGFLRHSVELNGGVLPFTTRTLFETAWAELLYKKHKEWKTVHSETTKQLALKNGLAQINIPLYLYFCQPRHDAQLMILEQEHTRLAFEPLPPLIKPQQFPLHPSGDYRISKIPEDLQNLAKMRIEESKHKKKKRAPAKSRKRAQPDEGDDEG